MNFRSAFITQDSPRFEEDIVGAIEDFWNTKSSSSPVWQTSRWCEFLLEIRQVKECVFVGMYSVDGILIGYTFVQIRDIWIGYTGGFVVGGPNILWAAEPTFRSWTVDGISYVDQPVPSENASFILWVAQDSENYWVDPLCVEIERILTQTWALFVQFEPVQDCMFSRNEPPWKHFLEPYSLILDLTLSEEALLTQMKQKGRYNIKLAEKQGILIELSRESEGLDHFMRLLGETLDRDGFSGNSREYYTALLASRSHMSEGLYLARKDWRVIAAAILVIEGNQAIYYYWASTSDNEFRKSMPAYLLQWRMIQAAKSAGCMSYDFLGIAPPGELDHPLVGVSDFKHKFGGQIVALPAKKMRVFRSSQYYLLRILRKMRWLFSIY